MTGISKHFGPVQALRDVNLTVGAGTVHALVGENGAGKSTLMKILAGVYQPDTGAIEIQGRRQVFANPAQALHAGVSMIYQELDLAEHLTVAENIFLGAEPRGRLPLTISHRQMTAQAAQLAQRYSFDIDPAAKVEDLATGDCQIVEILKALRHKASILVMDEPTSSLSEREAKRLFEVVRRLRARGPGHRLHLAPARRDHRPGRRGQRPARRRARPLRAAARLDIPKIVHYMVGRELTDFFPTRTAQIGDVLVQVQGLSSEAGIRDISFEVRRGEIVGMAGLVGAGRTEVARAIFGVDQKTAGQVTLDGRDTEHRFARRRDRQRHRLLDGGPQAHGAVPGAAVQLEHHAAEPRPDRLQAVHQAGPGEPHRRRTWAPAWRSSGPRRRRWPARFPAATSRSCSSPAGCWPTREFLIFDEPTRGIDVGAKAEVYSLLNKLAEEGKAILFISSELPELFGIADRILVMRRGQARRQSRDQADDAGAGDAPGGRGGNAARRGNPKFEIRQLAAGERLLPGVVPEIRNKFK